jgi:hypothetical protein
MTPTTSRNVLIAAAIGLLTSCGGGGGGGGETSSGAGAGSASATAGGTTATSPAVTSPATATRFSDISVPAGFSWQTTQAAPAVAVTVTSSSRPTLGGGRVVISNFIDKDPTGSGESIPAMSTDVIATALASNTSGSSASASFGALRLPAGTTHVLVEVFDMANGARLTSTKVAVASLLASGLRIDV